MLDDLSSYIMFVMNHSDENMVRFFADWMLKARAKYAKMKTPVQRFSENKTSGSLPSSQLRNFPNK